MRECWGCARALPRAEASPAAHTSAFLGRAILSDPVGLAELVNLGLFVIVSGARQGAWGESNNPFGAGWGLPLAGIVPSPLLCARALGR